MVITLPRGTKYRIELRVKEDRIEVKPDSGGRLRRKTLYASEPKATLHIVTSSPDLVWPRRMDADGLSPSDLSQVPEGVIVTVLSEGEV